MKLSLILLAHNEEANIKNEIENLYNNIASKVKECEVIICEDGSTNQTKKIINDLNKVYNFEYLSSDDRKGVSKAMIDGFKKARGECERKGKRRISEKYREYRAGFKRLEVSIWFYQ